MAKPTIRSGSPNRPSLESRAHIRAGYQALHVRAWAQARGAFDAALARQETPEALEGLGLAAWWLDDAASVLRAREGAYRLYRRQGDKRSAARLAIALASDSLHFRGEPAVARGWHRRAHDLLQDLDLVPEHGWLQLSEGDFALTLHGDPAAARVFAREAMGMGKALSSDDIHMLAHALEGAALVAEGQVAEGMSRLDGAVTAALAGELEDPLAIGYSCCYMLHACERVGDFDRAMQWCGRVQAFTEDIQCNALLAVCRTQHASVLIGRGQWYEAEQELHAVAQQLAASRPTLQEEALVRLAGLRRRQGRIDEASHLLSQVASHRLALLEQAALALDGGSARAALQLAERFLRRVPECNRMERLAGLDAALRAQLALGHHEQASVTLRELRAGADEVDVSAAAAARCLADGLLAASNGDHETARRAQEDAVDIFTQCGAVFEAARSRVELAHTLGASGQQEAALAEARVALATFEELGAASEVRRAATLLRDLSAPKATRTSCRPEGLSRRELEVLCLVAEGLSNRRIAARLHVSEFTVKRHVQNILTKLDLPTRAAASAYAARQGLL